MNNILDVLTPFSLTSSTHYRIVATSSTLKAFTAFPSNSIPTFLVLLRTKCLLYNTSSTKTPTLKAVTAFLSFSITPTFLVLFCTSWWL